MRLEPNILITGTPGTGKSTLAEMLQDSCPILSHLNISEIIKQRKLGDRYNAEWDTWEFDDDKVSPSLGEWTDVGVG
jgi:adenylate kinase